MKIGNPADKPTGVVPMNGHAAEAAKAAASASATPAAADPSAKVELSSAATTLLSGSTNAEFDADKVNRIAQAIADGTYQVNADVIADKLIGNARELLTRVQR